MKRFALLLAAMAFFRSVNLASAQTTFNWINTSGGSYHTTGNWTPGGGPPIVNDFARFGLSSTYNVTFANNGTQTIDFQVRGGNVTFSYLNTTAKHFWGANSTNYVGPQAGDAATSATLNLTNMSSNPMQGNHLVVGNTTGKTGTLNIFGNGHWKGYATSNVQIGNAGTGNLNISTVGILQSATLEAFNVGIGEGGTGTSNVSGLNALMTVGNVLTVGSGANGVGALTISNQGKVNVTDSVFIGATSQAQNAITVTGNNSTLSLGNDILAVGNSGSGTLSLLSGGKLLNSQSAMVLGQSQSGFGKVSVSGANSHFSSTGSQEMRVGDAGEGELEILSGGLADIARVRAGIQSGSSGKVLVAGTGSLLNLHGSTDNLFGAGGAGWLTIDDNATVNSNGSLILGSGGVGTLSISDGGQVYSASGRIGSQGSPSSSTATISGSDSLWSMTGQLDIGWDQYSQMNIDAGGAVNSQGGRLGIASGGTGFVQLTGNGSSWNTGSGTLFVGQSGSGSINVHGGAQALSSSVTLGSASVGDGTGWVFGNGSHWSIADALTIGSAGHGTFSVTGGGLLTLGNNSTLNIGSQSTADGLLRVVDQGSQVNLGTGSSLVVGASGLGRIDVLSGGVSATSATLGSNATGEGSALLRNASATWNLSNDLIVGAMGSGFVDIENGANLTASNILVAKSAGSSGAISLRGLNSSLATSQNLVLGGDNFFHGGAAELNINSGTLVDVGGALKLRSQGVLNLNGGTLRAASIESSAGQFYWPRGTVQFSTDTQLDSFLLDTLLGTSHTLNNFQTLEGAANTLMSLGSGSLTVDGGRLIASDFHNSGSLTVQRGSMTVLGELVNESQGLMSIQDSASLYAWGGISNHGTFLMNNVAAQNNGTLFTNHGTLAGTGRLNQWLVNHGTVQLGASDYLRVDSPSFASNNDGQLQLGGGRLEFTGQFDNLAGGLVTGHGTLATASMTGSIGLVNSGVIAASGETLDIYGDVRNATGGRIITSGDGTTTFWDDVEHNGAEIRTSLGSSTVFFGDVSGAGPFTGAGAVFFEGDLKPGNSPADVLFEGDIHFSQTASLSAELGGLFAGLEYDRLSVRGDIFLGGQLSVSLINGFAPSLGDMFLLIDNRGVNPLFGQFAGLGQGSILSSGNHQFQVDYFAGSSGRGLGLIVVPEPNAIVVLLGLCCLGSCLRIRTVSRK